MKSKNSILIIFAILLMGFISISVSNPGSEDYRNSREETIMMESWMTQPFTNFIEEPLELEDWMTKPFIIN